MSLTAKTKKRIILPAILLLTSVTVSACYGGRGHRHGGMDAEEHSEHMDRMINRADKKLDLSDAQTAQMKTLLTSMNEHRTALMGKENPRTELASLMAGTKFDLDGALNMVRKRTQYVDKNAPELLQQVATLFDGMTDEQKTKVRAMLESRRGDKN